MRLALGGWLLWMIRHASRLRRERPNAWRSAALAALVLQTPGIMAALAAMKEVQAAHPDLWAVGILELWTYPFASIWAWLPHASWRGGHPAFWFSCAVPLLAALTQVGVFACAVSVARTLKPLRFLATRLHRPRKTPSSRWGPLPSVVQSVASLRRMRHSGGGPRPRR